MDFATLLKNKPHLHARDGKPVLQSLHDPALRKLHDIVAAVPDAQTLETGNGLTTVVFAMAGAHHTSIAPDGDTFGRIREYCASHTVDLTRLNVICKYSQHVLPGLPQTPLDFVLIDGCHGFPTAFVDYAYTANRVKVGGYLMVDDTWLWTGTILDEFLSNDPAWTKVEDFPPKTVLFQKTAAVNCFLDWHAQPYTKKLSDEIKAARQAPAAVKPAG